MLIFFSLLHNHLLLLSSSAHCVVRTPRRCKVTGNIISTRPFSSVFVQMYLSLPAQYNATPERHGAHQPEVGLLGQT